VQPTARVAFADSVVWSQLELSLGVGLGLGNGWSPYREVS